jgi:hypothetical protein
MQHNVLTNEPAEHPLGITLFRTDESITTPCSVKASD